MVFIIFIAQLTKKILHLSQLLAKDRPIHRPADIIGRYLRFLRESASADTRMGSPIYFSAALFTAALSMGSSVLPEELQRMQTRYHGYPSPTGRVLNAEWRLLQ